MITPNLSMPEKDPFECSGARWIGRAGVHGNEPAPAPIFRRKFLLKPGIQKATLSVSGLGQYEGFVNSQPLDERIVFAPTTSDYTKTIYYNQYTVTDKLAPGENVLSFILGRGRYAFNTIGTPWNGETAPWIDAVKMIAVLEILYTDGTAEEILTDERWEAAESAIVQDCMYMGETYDAGRVDPDWEPCVLAVPPAGKLTYDFSEPIAVTERISPRSCTKIRDNVFVYEFEEYITGWIELRIDCPRDTRVSIQYTERKGENGKAVLEHSITPNGRLQRDYFISAGTPVTYRPSFSYKGFHYVQVEGIPNLTCADAIGCFFHNDITGIAQFSCSEPLITWIHNAFRRTVLCNFHGLSTDTPVFEKHGWGGDAAAIAPGVLFNFNAHRFYRKWLNDFRDSQTADGELSPIVPTPGWGLTGHTPWEAVCGPTPTLDICYPELVYQLYWHYEDTEVLQQHYAPLQKYAAYLTEWTGGELCCKGLGDWLAPSGDLMTENAEPPEGPTLVEGAYHIRIFERMEQIARALGAESDAAAYAAEHKRLIALYNKHYYDPEKGYYCSESYPHFRQAANVLALAFGIAGAEQKAAVCRNLLTHLEARSYHLDTGMYLTQYLPIALSEAGHHEIAWKVITAKGYPGWDYMRSRGARTISESWEYDSCRSHCHYANAAVESWIVTHLMGIHQLAPGYRKVRIDPQLPAGLDFAEYTLQTVRGSLHVRCERKNGKLETQISASEEIKLSPPISP